MLCLTDCKLVFMYFCALAGVPYATTHLLLFVLIVWTKSYEELKSRSCSLFIFFQLLFLSLSCIQISFSAPLFNRPQPIFFASYDGITFCPVTITVPCFVIFTFPGWHTEDIPSNNQLEAQFFFLICLFQFYTCFEQSCAHHQESQLYQYVWYMSFCIGNGLVCRLGWNSTVTYTE